MLRFQHLADLGAQALRGPAQVGLENLPDVHARRHAQRIQHDVHRRAVGHVRHVLDRNDGGNHALVAVASRHLVARLHAALHRQVHLDHLEHARRQIIARGDLRLLLLEALFKRLALTLQALGDRLQLRVDLFFLEANLEPLFARQVRQICIIDLRTRLDLLRARLGSLAFDHAAHALEQIVFQNALLIGQVLAYPLELRFLDRQGP